MHVPNHGNVEQSSQAILKAKDIDEAIFEGSPLSVKVWYAPPDGCNEVARDTIIPPDRLGNIREAVCQIWIDFVPLRTCSFELARPQPDRHTFGSAFHFVVFETHGPTAVLIRQSGGLRVDFCACALRMWHTVRSGCGLDQLHAAYRISDSRHRQRKICTCGRA